jgi:hypothetical protein
MQQGSLDFHKQEEKTSTGLDVYLRSEVNLGRYIPDKTALDQPTYCDLGNQGGVVTIPFVVYGEERVRGMKPGFYVDPDGEVTRRIIEGLGPEATVVAYDDRGRYLAWPDANKTTLLSTGRDGRRAWTHRLGGPGCARQGPDGQITVGSASGKLRRVDGAGTLLHDMDRVFSARPFSGPHGVDHRGSSIFLADPDATHSIWEIDPMGNVKRRIGSTDVGLNRSGKGLLCYPMDVILLASDHVCVAERGRKRVTVFGEGEIPVLTITSDDLGAEEICTSRLFSNRNRSQLLLFGRRDREVWLFGISLALTG